MSKIDILFALLFQAAGLLWMHIGGASAAEMWGLLFFVIGYDRLQEALK